MHSRLPLDLPALRVLVRDRLWENAEAMGRRFTERFSACGTVGSLEKPASRVSWVGLSSSRTATRSSPFRAEQIARIKEEVLAHGVITAASGPCGNVFRIQPPLVTDAAQVDTVVAAFDDAIESVTSGGKAQA